MSPNRHRHNQDHQRHEAINRELEELRQRAWRYRCDSFNLEFAPTPVNDPGLSSRMFGPETKTVQWKRE